MIHEQWVNYSLTRPDGLGQGVNGSGHKKIMGWVRELMGRPYGHKKIMIHKQ